MKKGQNVLFTPHDGAEELAAVILDTRPVEYHIDDENNPGKKIRKEREGLDLFVFEGLYRVNGAMAERCKPVG